MNLANVGIRYAEVDNGLDEALNETLWSELREQP